MVPVQYDHWKLSDYDANFLSSLVIPEVAITVIVIMMPTLSSQEVPEVVIMTTSGAFIDDKVGIFFTLKI